MRDEGDSGRHAGFLPPEPTGPEPDLGTRPAGESAAAAPDPGAPRHRGFAPPAEHERHAPPGQAYAQPRQPGWAAPPGQPQPWAHPGPAVPDNGPAVAGLSLSIAAGTLLLLSAGTSSVVSIVCAALGIRFSRKGRDRVDRGETPKYRGVAQAGYVTGLVTLGLSILCTLFWLTVVVLYATNEDFRQDLKDQLDDGGGTPPGGSRTSLEVGALAVRLLASLIR